MVKVKIAIPHNVILTSNLSGISGEYFVAAQLSRLGYVASITPKNTKNIDILASNQEGSKTVAIQVKTNKNGVKKWMFKAKSETNFSNNYFYVLVDLKDSKSLPEFHIVPSKVVSKKIRKDHLKWLNTLGAKGQKRNDIDMRMFSDLENAYKDKWDSLGLRKITKSEFNVEPFDPEKDMND